MRERLRQIDVVRNTAARIIHGIAVEQIVSPVSFDVVRPLRRNIRKKVMTLGVSEYGRAAPERRVNERNGYAADRSASLGNNLAINRRDRLSTRIAAGYPCGHGERENKQPSVHGDLKPLASCTGGGFTFAGSGMIFSLGCGVGLGALVNLRSDGDGKALCRFFGSIGHVQ